MTSESVNFIEKSDLNGIPVRSGAPLRRIVALRTESVPEIEGTRIKDLYLSRRYFIT